MLRDCSRDQVFLSARLTGLLSSVFYSEASRSQIWPLLVLYSYPHSLAVSMEREFSFSTGL